ncbi:MAG: hypothetical protein KME11_18200 [Timaviella obliquedivisa GSE-PSE-MK23-08B]|jgi:hypothetical protein|nr:hypothetical protein [Timaviella obliquedivisa GSE-PSE-MK23-08B]
MRVWAVCFVLFFGAAEFYQWMQGLTLPLPFFIALGGLLAIASNADKWRILNRPVPSAPSTVLPTQPAPITAAPNPVSFTIPKRKSAILPVLHQEKGA